MKGAKSSKSFRFSAGRTMQLTPTRLAAMIFSLIPPTGSTLPVSDTSPVMAKFCRMGCFDANDNKAVTIVHPALGPSLGVAP